MTNVQDTSLLAYYNDVIPRISRSQRIVLEEILKHPEGITNQEIHETTKIPINCITPRCKELRDKKLVVEMTRRKCKSSGRLAIAWTYNKNYDLEKSHLKLATKERIISQRSQPLLV